jgi:hypothetical protein
VLARMLIFRTLVKRSTVHNNGNGDVNVRNDVLRDPENVWFFNIFVNIQSPSRISRRRRRSDSSHHVDSCKSNIPLTLL